MLIRLLILLFVLFNSVCFGQWKSYYPEKKSDKKEGLVNEKNEKNHLHYNSLFFSALKQKSLENYESSLSLFEKCINKNPDLIEPYYQASLVYKKLNKILQAREYSAKTVDFDSKNIWYLRNYAEILFLNQEFHESAKQYIDVIGLEPNNELNYYKLADTYIYSKKYLKAINTYNDLEKKKGIDKMVSMQKHKLYMQINDIRNATKTLEDLSNTHPNDIEVLHILAEAYVLSNKKDEAFTVFQKISNNDPNNGQIHLTLANFYRDNGDLDNSYKELKKAFESEKVPPETKLAILSSYTSIISANDTIKKQAFELADILLDKNIDNSSTNAIYGDFYYALGDKKKAKYFYREAIKTKKSIRAVWTQLLFLEIEDANYDSLRILSKEAILYYPTEALYYYFYGISSSFFKDYKNAVEFLETGIGFVFDNDALYSEFQSSLADAYHSIGMHAKSDSLYDLVLMNNPNNIIVLNNYSYYLSLRKTTLEKAKEMSKRCNDLEPNNGTYQDTYAWILYCLGKYESAKKWIEKALLNGSDKSSVVVEHYGDILFKLNLKEKALLQWYKAKSLGEGSDFLDKKIQHEDLFE